MKKLVIASLVMACTLIGTTGCGKKEDGKRHLAFVTNCAASFWTIARRGCEKADAELENVEVTFKIPGSGGPAEQKSMFDDLLSIGVDGIAISPLNPQYATKMLNDGAKQTLLFTHDSDAPKSDRVCYVGTDNTQAGVMAGELIKEALPNGGKIMIFVGNMDSANAIERTTGIKSAIKGTKISIVDIRTDDTDRARAKANVEDTMVKYPDIAGMIGVYDYNGPAIYGAVKDAGKVGKIKIVCFDEDAISLQGIQEGVIFGTVVQQPFEFGYQSIKMMNAYLDGDKSVVPASKKVIVPTKAIVKGNVDEFITTMKKLLGN